MRFKLFLMIFAFFIFCGCNLQYNSGMYRTYYSEIEPPLFFGYGFAPVLVHTANPETILERYKQAGFIMIGVSQFVSEDPHLSFIDIMRLAQEKGAHAVIIYDKYLDSQTRKETSVVSHTSPVFTTGNIMRNGKYLGTYNNTSYVTTYTPETRDVTHYRWEHNAYFMRFRKQSSN